MEVALTARTKVVWAVPFFLALHNGEEALTFPAYLAAMGERAPLLMRRFAGEVNAGDLYGALWLVTLVPALVSLWSWLRPQSRLALWSVLLIQATVFLNVFTHLWSAFTVFRGYGPGVLTALVLNLPFSIYVFRRARAEKWLTRSAALWLIPATLFLHGPGLIAAFALGTILS